MRKLFLSILIFLIHSTIFLHAQVECNKINFKGVAPAIWSINGQINDWETILGAGTGNPLFPFNPLNTPILNYFDEIADFDTPDPSRDLRFFAFIHDDNNVYFYLRRIQNGNAQNTFYYFCDINLDGLMSFGEPVFYANFNARSISSITLGIYKPNISIDYDVNGAGNYMARPFSLGGLSLGCTVDGYSMNGDIVEIFNSSSIPSSNLLLENEIFSAAITEDGYGIEFAVPWRYLKNWITLSSALDPTQNRDLFAYRISIQNGSGKYQPNKIADNAGEIKNCGLLFPGPNLAISGVPDFALQSSSVQTLLPGSFRIKLNYLNIKNAVERLELRNIIFKNIEATEGTVANVSGFTVKAYIDKNCNQIIDADELPTSFVYSEFFSNQDSTVYVTTSPSLQPSSSVDPMQSVCFIVDITFPINNSVQNCKIEIRPRASIPVISICPCDGCGPLDGGKPINPIGFTLSDDETTTTKDKRHQGDIDKINNFENGIFVFPNPSTGTINIALPDNPNTHEILLTDYTGKVMRKLITTGQGPVKIENLKPGLYVLNIRSRDGTLKSTRKVIIQ